MKRGGKFSAHLRSKNSRITKWIHNIYVGFNRFLFMHGLRRGPFIERSIKELLWHLEGQRGGSMNRIVASFFGGFLPHEQELSGLFVQSRRTLAHEGKLVIICSGCVREFLEGKLFEGGFSYKATPINKKKHLDELKDRDKAAASLLSMIDGLRYARKEAGGRNIIESKTVEVILNEFRNELRQHPNSEAALYLEGKLPQIRTIRDLILFLSPHRIIAKRQPRG